MIDDLDQSISALLTADLPPQLVNQISISFATPDEQFPPASVALPAIDLFLYDIRENLELRANDWPVHLDGNRFLRTPPSVRVDCSYLVTAWASDSSPTRALDEHRLLSEAMMVLLRHPRLPNHVLHGRLQQQELPLPAVTLQPGRLQSMGEFWQALGGKPKAAFGYTVTIGLQPFDAIDAGGVVEEMTLDIYKKKRGRQRRVETREVRLKGKR